MTEDIAIHTFIFDFDIYNSFSLVFLIIQVILTIPARLII